MKIKSKEFRDLQKEWYRKLEEVGFNDIEKNTRSDNIIIQESTSSDNSEYYRQAAFFLYNYEEFRNDKHRKVWELHSQGKTQKEIVIITGISRCSISLWIIKYAKVMKKEIMKPVEPAEIIQFKPKENKNVR